MLTIFFLSFNVFFLLSTTFFLFYSTENRLKSIVFFVSIPSAVFAVMSSFEIDEQTSKTPYLSNLRILAHTQRDPDDVMSTIALGINIIEFFFVPSQILLGFFVFGVKRVFFIAFFKEFFGCCAPFNHLSNRITHSYLAFHWREKKTTQKADKLWELFWFECLCSFSCCCLFSICTKNETMCWVSLIAFSWCTRKFRFEKNLFVIVYTNAIYLNIMIAHKNLMKWIMPKKTPAQKNRFSKWKYQKEKNTPRERPNPQPSTTKKHRKCSFSFSALFTIQLWSNCLWRMRTCYPHHAWARKNNRNHFFSGIFKWLLLLVFFLCVRSFDSLSPDSWLNVGNSIEIKRIPFSHANATMTNRLTRINEHTGNIDG